MKPSKDKRLGAGRVAFLARVEVIREKIDAGHTMASIYEDYQKQLGIGYKQFVNYVNKFIRDKPTTEKEKEVQNEETRNTPTASSRSDEGGKKQSIAETFRSTDDLDDFL